MAKTTLMNFRVPNELADWLSQEAKRQHRSKTSLVTHLLATVANLTTTQNKSF